MTDDVIVDDAMADLETLGTRAGCVILSIGAVGFNSEKGIDVGFYRVINKQDCLNHGMFIDPETQQWWDNQSEDAKTVLRLAESTDTSIPLKQALLEFNDYLSQFGKNVKLWGNGASFDNAILIDAYARTGVKRQWKYNNDRCYRTLKEITPWVKLERYGTYHNALDDAKSQALHAIECYNDLGSLFAHKNSIEDLQKKLDAAILLLSDARSGLTWYHEEYPERTTEADYEMIERMDKFIDHGEF